VEVATAPASDPVAPVVFALPDAVPVPVAPEPAVVDGAAVEAAVTVAEATQSFWQFSYARFSAAVPFPWEQLEMQSIVAFCWALLPSETAIHFALQLGSAAGQAARQAASEL